MFKNYFKIAWRNLFRNKIYSLVNIIGLSIGLTGCLLVSNIVIDDLSYDKQWANGLEIFRVIQTNKGTEQTIPSALSGLGPALQKNFPEVKQYCRLNLGSGNFINDNKSSFIASTIITESSFLNIFDFIFLHGSPQINKSGYTNIIITQKISDQYFPGINPTGKILQKKLSNGNIDSIQYVISGVIKNIPYNSHLRADVIVLSGFEERDNQFSSTGTGSLEPLYVLLEKGTNLESFTNKINKWYKNMVDNGQITTYNFQPIADVYLHSDFANGYQYVISSINNIYIFSGIALALLLIACFNFVNLTTARALKRMPETGMRKVLGASRRQLIIQFLFESLFFFILSFTLAIFLYNFFVPPVEKYIGHKLTISLLNNIQLLVATFTVVLLVCIFTGLYPAFILSRIQPAIIFKGRFTRNAGSGFLRKSLVTSQFIICIIIIIATVVVQTQIHFLNTKDIGYDKNNLLGVYNANWGTLGQAFKQQIKHNAGVQNASVANWFPGAGGSMSTEIDDPSGKGKKIDLLYIEGDVDFAATLKLQLQKGRLLSHQLASDILDEEPFYKNKDYDKLSEAQKYQSVLINAYAAKLLGINNVNSWLNSAQRFQGKLVGIVKDFNNKSLRNPMSPCIIKGNDNINYGNLFIRVVPGAEQGVLKLLNDEWKKFYPSETLQYYWVSDILKSQYEAERKIFRLFMFFSCLMIFLACLGLFGLVVFTTELRTKEIGIRKILGANARIIATLILNDFLKLIFIAFVIASPFAYWLMSKWLQNYAYRIQFSLWMFLIAGMIVLLIAVITISSQTIKAAIANPVKSLRSE